MGEEPKEELMKTGKRDKDERKKEGRALSCSREAVQRLQSPHSGLCVNKVEDNWT